MTPSDGTKLLLVYTSHSLSIPAAANTMESFQVFYNYTGVSSFVIFDNKI